MLALSGPRHLRVGNHGHGAELIPFEVTHVGGRQHLDDTRRMWAGNPANAKTTYGWPFEGIFASVPKTTVKIRSVISGLRMAQAAPMAVCLYRTFIWRQTIK
jgi:hypothetical protein